MDFVTQRLRLLQRGLDCLQREYPDMQLVDIRFNGTKHLFIPSFHFNVVTVDTFLAWGQYRDHEYALEHGEVLRVHSSMINNSTLGCFFLSHRWGGEGTSPDEIDNDLKSNYKAACELLRNELDNVVRAGRGYKKFRDVYKYIFIDYCCLPQGRDAASRLVFLSERKKLEQIQELCITLVVGHNWSPRAWLLGELCVALNSKGLKISGLSIDVELVQVLQALMHLLESGATANDWRVPVLRADDKAGIFFDIQTACQKLELHFDGHPPQSIMTYTRLRSGRGHVSIGSTALEDSWRKCGFKILY